MGFCRQPAIRLCCLMLVTGPVAGQGFPTELFGATEPLHAVVGIGPPMAVDLDGDGLDDVVARRVTHDVVVFLNLDAGAFEPPSDYPLPLTPTIGWPIRAADLDLDGDLDLVMANVWAPEIVSLPGSGDGGLLAAIGTVSPKNSGAMELGDVDGDGLVDLVYAEYISNWSGKLLWQRGRGDHSFDPPVLLTPTKSVTEIELCDLDLDGRLDILALLGGGFGGAASGVLIVRSLGGGDFEILPSLHAAGDFGGPSLEVSDFDRDGFPDLVLSIKAGSIDVALGLGGGAFAPLIGVPFPTVWAAFALWVDDLDRDGWDDVLAWQEFDFIAQRIGPDLSLLGGPSLTPQEAGSFGRELGDLDGDGLLEPVVNLSTNYVIAFMPNLLGHVIDLGFGFPAGSAPVLDVTGEPLPDHELSCVVSGVAVVPGLLVLGTSPAHLAVPGGTLVPAPQAILPLRVGTTITGRWPAEFPAGAALYVQAWLPTGGPAASNAVVLIGQ